jgi:hypothetical protein
LNAVYANCRSTGGSALINRDELQNRVANREFGLEPEHGMSSEYWADFRPLRTVTLEDLMREQGFDTIDVLKLDCEGSEFSILGKTPSLDRIGLIVGEYHGKEKFEQLVAERFAHWELKILRDGDLGTFWLTNPNYEFGERNAEQVSPEIDGNGDAGANGTVGRVSRPVQVFPPDRNADTSNNGLRKGLDPNHGTTPDDLFGRSEESIGNPIPIFPRENSISREEFPDRLKNAFHPKDLDQLDILLPYYKSLFELAREWNARRIVEIGVRAGYSALTMLLANPGATLIGIDADEDERFANSQIGSKGYWHHAQAILKSFDFHLRGFQNPRADTKCHSLY